MWGDIANWWPRWIHTNIRSENARNICCFFWKQHLECIVVWNWRWFQVHLAVRRKKKGKEKTETIHFGGDWRRWAPSFLVGTPKIRRSNGFTRRRSTRKALGSRAIPIRYRNLVRPIARPIDSAKKREKSIPRAPKLKIETSPTFSTSTFYYYVR